MCVPDLSEVCVSTGSIMNKFPSIGGQPDYRQGDIFEFLGRPRFLSVANLASSDCALSSTRYTRVRNHLNLLTKHLGSHNLNFGCKTELKFLALCVKRRTAQILGPHRTGESVARWPNAATKTSALRLATSMLKPEKSTNPNSPGS